MTIPHAAASTTTPDEEKKDDSITLPLPVDRHWIAKLLKRYPNPNARSQTKALVVAPMVDQSDLPFRLLCRRYGSNLCYTPMIHARLVTQVERYRQKFLGTWLSNEDRPLIAQLCGSDPDTMLAAARLVEPYVDGIDINCGCPQGIAKRGNYGAYLLEQEETLLPLVRHLAQHLKVPLSIKVRLLPGPDVLPQKWNNGDTAAIEEAFDVPTQSLALYGKLIDAGIHLLTIHGRTRKQKQDLTGPSDWQTIAKAVQMYGHRIPIFANGSIYDYHDVEECLKVTGVDGVMSSEALLEYPAIFYREPQEADLKNRKVETETQQLGDITLECKSPLEEEDYQMRESNGRRTIGRLRLAEEYMELAAQYPPECGGQGSGLKCLRAHLHHFLHKDLQEDVDLRHQVVSAKTRDDLEACLVVCRRKHERNGHQVANEQLSWYIRHRAGEKERIAALVATSTRVQDGSSNKDGAAASAASAQAEEEALFQKVNSSFFGGGEVCEPSSPHRTAATTMATATETETRPLWSSCRIFFSTQSGRAKACARRVSRILREEIDGVELIGAIKAFDDDGTTPFVETLLEEEPSSSSNSNTTLNILFVSTTGDGEHCDTIRETWKALLQKSLSTKQIGKGHSFAMFCLGDRAYGPQFCAAGRKLAVRLLQLGMKTACEVGYGDDDTPDGGVFRDLDGWWENQLKPILAASNQVVATDCPPRCTELPICPYCVTIWPDAATSEDTPLKEQWQQDTYRDTYAEYFAASAPLTAYAYHNDDNQEHGFVPVDPLNLIRANDGNGDRDRTNNCRRQKRRQYALMGTVVLNERITDPEWEQDTRSLRIRVTTSSKGAGSCAARNCDDKKNDRRTYYDAGDVASILPFNEPELVERFLRVLPPTVASAADSALDIELDNSMPDQSFPTWPRHCTLRGWLTHCADIHSLPEREDLRALSVYCSPDHPLGKEQGEKLRSLSETSEAALYADYILLEKRSWADVLYDFESLRVPGSRLTLERLFMLLPPIRPREFSIASAPLAMILDDKDTTGNNKGGTNHIGHGLQFEIELCVAVVQGTTKRGRKFRGLSSNFLARSAPSRQLVIWIRPGSFGKLPLQLDDHRTSFKTPVLCVGAGTGVAPMRSLLLERMAVRALARQENGTRDQPTDTNENENVLVFGCRRKKCDYYYEDEWTALSKNKQMRLLTAFSRDQFQKIYVQRVLREADEGNLIAAHIVDRGGAVYIAGGPRMARSIKDEIVEVLTERLGSEKLANQHLTRMRQAGKFSIEAWS